MAVYSPSVRVANSRRRDAINERLARGQAVTENADLFRSSAARLRIVVS
jgi:hypothetical protein